MIESVILALFVLAPPQPPQSVFPPTSAQVTPMIVIQAYDDGAAGGCTANPGVRLSVGRDPSIADERVLIVDYPPPTNDPAARDVRCAAARQDWTSGRAIAFQVKPAHSMRMSVSFLDRNHVAYT